MGNKKFIKKFKRKIKIRLADPNVPDSYVCEIFDSSLENEEEQVEETHILSKDSFDVKNPELKNYFEILMSNDCKRNGKIDSVKFNSKEDKNENKLTDNGCNKVVNRKLQPMRNNEKIFQLNEGWCNNTFENDSSDDEKLLDGRRKCKNVQIRQLPLVTVQDKTNTANILYETKETLDSPPNSFNLKKKDFNILNYFSKLNSFDEGLSKTEETSKENNDCLSKSILYSSNCKSWEEKNQNVEGGQKPVKIVNKENLKLAPLFLKKEKKVISAEVQKARYNFLHSRSSSMLNCSDSSKNVETGVDFQPAPHIQQKDESAYWSRRKILLPQVKIDLVGDYVFDNKNPFRLNLNKKKIEINNSNKIENSVAEINNKMIDKLKSKYKIFNLDVLINGLKERRDKFLKLSEEIGLKNRTKKYQMEDISKDECSLEVLNSLWTEKYKPSSSELLGNELVVNKLKNWLLSWKSFENQQSCTTKSFTKHQNDSEDDDVDDDDLFIGSDDERLGLKPPLSICLLSGPNSSGKTALVGALAKEFDFNVLEVNASSKRTGKKVLMDLQEATQSHKVHRITVPASVNSQCKKIKNKKKQKKKTIVNDLCKSSNEADRKMSLLVIEDADIVFDEHDEGFYSAIASLVQTSKRPFIFIANDVSCVNMDYFKTEECLKLEMKQPPFHKSYALLDVISCLEGLQGHKEALQFLLIRNKLNLRKCLMELQFWNCSDEKLLKLGQPFDLGRLWWGLSKFLYRRSMQHFVNTSVPKRKRENNLFDSSEEETMTTKKMKINSEINKQTCIPGTNIVAEAKSDFKLSLYSKVLDVASTLDLIGLSLDDEPLNGQNCVVKDSLSLEENMEPVFWAETDFKQALSNELIYWSTKAFHDEHNQENYDKKKISFESPSWEEIRWRNVQEKTREDLSNLIPTTNGRDNRSLHLDYLPIIRNICRTERNRAVVNVKRKNRFSHYFNFKDVELSEKTLKVTCEVFS